MLKKLKSKFRQTLLKRWNLPTNFQFGRPSYSQEGEDVLLWRMMDRYHTTATYVDVGCNHPYCMSNTAFFYDRGWSGIAIDPNPEFQQAFAELRPRDTFINCGVGTKTSELTYHEFEEPLYNTFDANKASAINRDNSRQIAAREVTVRPLREILDKVWPEGQAIRLLSVDCEGMDLEVLRSHDFDKYPVEFACIEVGRKSLNRSRVDPAISFMERQGFIGVAKLHESAILIHSTEAEKWGGEI